MYLLDFSIKSSKWSKDVYLDGDDCVLAINLFQISNEKQLHYQIAIQHDSSRFVRI